MPRKGVTKDGQLIDLGEPGVVSYVDTDEPGHEIYIEAVRKQYARENRSVVAGAAPVANAPVEAQPQAEVAEVADVPDDASSAVELVEDASVPITTGSTSEGALQPNVSQETVQDSAQSAEKLSETSQGVSQELSQGQKPEEPPHPFIAEFGERAAQALIDAGFHDREALRKATDAELLAVSGVGPGTIKKIRQIED